MTQRPNDLDFMAYGKIAAMRAANRLAYGITPADIDDMIAVSQFTYWTHLQQGHPPKYAYRAAYNESLRCFFDQCKGRNPRYTVSLDQPVKDDGCDLYELVNAPQSSPDECEETPYPPAMIAALLTTIRARITHAPARSMALKAVDQDAQIIALAAQGHSNVSIGLLLGMNPATVDNRRKRTKAQLKALLPPDTPPLYTRQDCMAHARESRYIYKRDANAPKTGPKKRPAEMEERCTIP